MEEEKSHKHQPQYRSKELKNTKQIHLTTPITTM